MKPDKWTAAELTFLCRYYRALGAKNIAKELGRPFWGTARKASRLGLKTGPREKVADIHLVNSLTDIEAAYLAGFFDGEGTLGMKDYGQRRVVAYLSLVSTDHEAVLWMQSKIGGKVSGGRKKIKHWHRQVYQWQTERAAHVLAITCRLAPYMIIKRKHAEIITQACRLRLNRPRCSKSSNEEFELLTSLAPLQMKRKPTVAMLQARL